jgi:hypothetical protein
MKIADFLWPRSREPVLRCRQGLRITGKVLVRPHQFFGAETAFAETARFIKVSALIR